MHERGDLKAMLLETFLIVARTVLRPAIGMVDAPLWWAAQCHGHIQRTDCKASFHPVTNHCPAVDTMYL